MERIVCVNLRGEQLTVLLANGTTFRDVARAVRLNARDARVVLLSSDGNIWNGADEQLAAPRLRDAVFSESTSSSIP